MEINVTDLLRQIPGAAEVSGRLSVPETPESLHRFGVVCEEIAAAAAGADTVTVTGAGPVWAYLILFHSVAHRVRSVFYKDGKNQTHLICKHG
jgi:hypothetical protein